MKIPINLPKTCPINSEIYRDSDVGDLVNSIGEVDFIRIGDFTWRVSYCEELVGIIHWGMMLKENCQRERSYYRENVTPLR